MLYHFSVADKQFQLFPAMQESWFSLPLGEKKDRRGEGINPIYLFFLQIVVPNVKCYKM